MSDSVTEEFPSIRRELVTSLRKWVMTTSPKLTLTTTAESALIALALQAGMEKVLNKLDAVCSSQEKAAKRQNQDLNTGAQRRGELTLPTHTEHGIHISEN